MATMTPNMNPLDPRAQQVASVDPASLPITQDPASAFETPPLTPPPAPVDESAPAPLPSSAALAIPMTNTTTQEQKTELRSEDMKALSDIAKQREAEITANISLIEKATEAETKLADNAIAKAEAAQAEMIASETAFKAKSERLQNEYQQAYKDYTSFKIDPKNFWADKTTGDKIGLVLLAAIGGGAAGYSGRQGPDFSGMIDRAITQDIENQKLQMERLKGNADLANNQYAQAFSVYQNELQAKLAVKAAGYELIEAKLNKDMGGIKNAIALSNAKMQKLDAAEKAAMARAELNKSLKTTTSETKNVVTSPEVMKSKEEKYTIFGQARTKETADKIANSQVLMKSINRDASKYIDIVKKVGTVEKLTSAEKGILRQTQDRIINTMRELNGLGTLQQGEFDRLQKTMGGLWSGEKEAAAFVSQLSDSYADKLTDIINTEVMGLPKKLEKSQVMAKIYRGETDKIAQQYTGKSNYMVGSDARNKNKTVAGR